MKGYYPKPPSGHLSATLTMLPKPIQLWFFFSSLVVFWDAGYLMMRPRSMVGGDLHSYWKPYALYSTIDTLYSKEAFLQKDPFPVAQSILGYFEIVFNFYALYLNAAGKKSAIPVALVTLTMTFWKTVLYFMMDIVSGLGSSGHNDWLHWITLYLIPNGIWILVPLLSMITLTSKITTALNTSPKKYQ